MDKNKRSANRKSTNRRSAKKNKSKKIAIIIATVVVVILAIYLIANSLITNMYNKGGKVPLDIRTAEELKDDVLNILVCGLDWDESRTGMMADVIMYVTIDAKAKKVSVLQIPRDTYIDADTATGKINSAFNSGGEKEKVMNIVKAVNEKFSLPIDHYITLNMEAFITMVDAVEGGLEIYVPCPIIAKDEKTGKEEAIIETAGWYFVDGATAEAIVRNRNYGEADIKRLEVQGYFYAAVIKYFKDIGLSDSLKLMPRFTPHITTDLHWTQMASIAATGLKISYSDMTLIKPPVHGGMYKGQAVVALPRDRSEWLDIINTYFRPYQAPFTENDIKIKDITGGYTTDYGITKISIQTVGDILGGAGVQVQEPEQDTQSPDGSSDSTAE